MIPCRNSSGGGSQAANDVTDSKPGAPPRQTSDACAPRSLNFNSSNPRQQLQPVVRPNGSHPLEPSGSCRVQPRARLAGYRRDGPDPMEFFSGGRSPEDKNSITRRGLAPAVQGALRLLLRGGGASAPPPLACAPRLAAAVGTTARVKVGREAKRSVPRDHERRWTTRFCKSGGGTTTTTSNRPTSRTRSDPAVQGV